ncbi:hypothetical protein D6851_15810 [Altericroceibacterium spongiae]|uniref:PIN domain-containing protein n=1 Tax=Altericroceibacterium spongiae TaxID=2320269 RepID=A0A420EAP3_9SPHN|nr:hypothetical protein D6851_15810 [Altericroceibacterium spongiae]
MIVDTSAVVAVLYGEPESRDFVQVGIMALWNRLKVGDVRRNDRAFRRSCIVGWIFPRTKDQVLATG